jgi:hypothetical protein
MMGDQDKDVPLGPAGLSFIPLEGNMVTYQGISKRRFLNSLPNAKIYYGQSKNASIQYFTDDEATRDSLKDGERIQQFKLSKPCYEFKFRIPLADALAVYGVSFEGNTGITLDNFSMRGNSGIGLSSVKEDMYRNFDELHHYDLVVMQYGLNVASEKAKNYDWYVRSMKQTIAMIKRAFPHSAILLVGVSDRAAKVNGELQTMPMLKELIDVQRQMAADNGICFWDMFEAMGGDSTMVNWANMSKHAYANKDYTHLTFYGGKKMAEIMVGTLLYEKEKYDRRKKSM